MADYEDVIPLPIFGPSLTINGHSAQWNGSVAEKENNSGLKMRLQFEAETGLKATSSIDITNDGTAAIYYSWRVRIYCFCMLRKYQVRQKWFRNLKNYST